MKGHMFVAILFILCGALFLTRIYYDNKEQGPTPFKISPTQIEYWMNKSDALQSDLNACNNKRLEAINNYMACEGVK